MFGAASEKFVLGVSARFTIPLLSGIPVIGAAFKMSIHLEILILLIAVVAWYVLYKTRYGMNLRACGDTDGNYLGMGWLDRKDILSWINWIVAQDSDARIVIHGISMGAATTMMTAGEDTPDQVVAFIEDCGYTSVWDEYAGELKNQFGLPAFPLLHLASWATCLRYGWDFREASPLEQVKNAGFPCCSFTVRKTRSYRLGWATACMPPKRASKSCGT